MLLRLKTATELNPECHAFTKKIEWTRHKKEDCVS
jgi:hypothetical protein